MQASIAGDRWSGRQMDMFSFPPLVQNLLKPRVQVLSSYASDVMCSQSVNNSKKKTEG